MASHNYKLLVIDIDGTLVGKNNAISRENMEALSQAKQAGMKIAVSTGRSLVSCRKIMEQLPLDGCHIFFDGALVSRADLSEEVYAQPLDPAIVRRMIDYAKHEGISLELFSTTRYFADRRTWSTEAHQEFFGINATISDLSGLWEKERIIKGSLVSTTPGEAGLTEKFKNHFADIIYLSQARTPVYPGVVFNNVLTRGVSKGTALKALAAHLNIDLDSVMAIGDGSNDIALLSTAGLAIAMGNASDEVKSVADHITLDVDRHGLAAAIHRFLL